MVHIFNVQTIIMQSMSIKKWKLLELQIKQTNYPQDGFFYTTLTLM